MSRYRKLIAPLVVSLIAGLKVLSDALGDATVSAQETTAMIIALLSAALVYLLPNDPPAGQPADPNVSERG